MSRGACAAGAPAPASAKALPCVCHAGDEAYAGAMKAGTLNGWRWGYAHVGAIDARQIPRSTFKAVRETPARGTVPA